ncbi:MAG: hypothetical protein HYY61_00510 [Deltaproteobacteria bacterium]|nr:hypothetical protein [Deltaproteobacteria bacterium]
MKKKSLKIYPFLKRYPFPYELSSPDLYQFRVTQDKQDNPITFNEQGKLLNIEQFKEKLMILFKTPVTSNEVEHFIVTKIKIFVLIEEKMGKRVPVVANFRKKFADNNLKKHTNKKVTLEEYVIQNVGGEIKIIGHSVFSKEEEFDIFNALAHESVDCSSPYEESRAWVLGEKLGYINMELDEGFYPKPEDFPYCRKTDKKKK